MYVGVASPALSITVTVPVVAVTLSTFVNPVNVHHRISYDPAVGISIAFPVPLKLQFSKLLHASILRAFASKLSRIVLPVNSAIFPSISPHHLSVALVKGIPLFHVTSHPIKEAAIKL